MDNTNKNYIKKIKETYESNFSFWKLFWIFYIGCFSGVIVEIIWCLAKNGYFEYRTALILEPLNPVYGFGAVVISLLLFNMKKCTNFTLYFASFIIGGLFECACSLFQELVFGTVSWVYKPSNFGILGNRTSLLYCFFWGFLGIAWLRLIYPVLSKSIDKILTSKYGKKITITIAIFVSFDILFSSGAVLRQKERRNQIPPKNFIDTFYDNHFSDDILKFFYHNITVIE